MAAAASERHSPPAGTGTGSQVQPPDANGENMIATNRKVRHDGGKRKGGERQAGKA
jgi:hypothetical protein